MDRGLVMIAFSDLLNGLRDLQKIGPSFLLSGISSRVSRKETVLVKISRNIRAEVRPRQSDFSTLQQIFRDQEYLLPTYVAEHVDKELRRIVASGSVPVIVDAGANIGAASIWFRSRFPDATIVAIEPDASNAEIARRNISGLQDVILVEAAVGGEAGFASIVEAEQGWAVQTERADTGCPIVTINQAVRSVPSGKLLIAKIDIEGFESDLFVDNLEWLDEALVVYIEPHDWMLPGEGTSRGFQKAFGERDFEIFIRGENLIYMRRP
jgi:FkbM family methyltransferase